MVHPGAFQGSRKDFLLNEKQTYASAVAGGYAKDALADIQRRYFKRFPVNLPHDEEPSAEHLASINDNDPDPEPVEPDKESLNPEEYKKAMEGLDQRRKLLTQRKEQIKRWLVYQCNVKNTIGTRDSMLSNPFHRLMSGTSSKPRHSSAMNTWRKLHRQEIEQKVNLLAQKEGRSRKNLAPLREQVARGLFDKLTQEERDDWARTAKENYEEAMTKWNSKSIVPLSSSPAERQKCIQNLPHVIQPVLDSICAATGWKATLIAGGPEPAHDGRLNVISIHSGVTKGDVKMNFGRAEPTRYQTQIVPIFGDFLKKCYSVDDCCACALDDGECLQAMGLEDINVDSVSMSSESASHKDSVPHPKSSVHSQESSLESQLPNFRECSEDVNLVHGNVLNQSDTYIPSRGPTPAASRGPTPVPSRGPTPAASRGPTPAASRGPTPPIQVQAPAPKLAQKSLPVATNELDLLRATCDNPMDLDDEVTPSPPLPSTNPSSTSVGSSSVSTEEPSRVLNSELDSTLGSKHKRAIEDEGGTGTSKRKRLSYQCPTDKEDVASKPASSARSTRHNKNYKKAQPAKTRTTAASVQSWFSLFQELFLEKDLGKDWVNLISCWVAFEVQSQSRALRLLPSKGRPEAVGLWIKNGRKLGWRPSIPDLQNYKEEFNMWWKSLQPLWRIQDGIVNAGLIEGNWDCLMIPGQNGVLSIVAGLFFWGLELESQGKSVNHKSWLAAVRDSHLAFSSF